ncbi:MAG TPA: methyltransferase domain-containing protein [Nocardioidaceae bacterium]
MVERRSAIRAALVWDALFPVLQARHEAVTSAHDNRDKRPLEVVDLGGGTGGLAVRIAELGPDVVQVLVVDPSPDALASLERRAAEADVADAVRGVLGDAATLLDLVTAGTVDVVVCHEVLEVVDVPAQAVEAAAAVLAPGGVLSLVAAQRSAAVFARAVAGHVTDARTLLTDPDGRWGSTDPMPRRFTRDELTGLLEDAGLTVAEVRGVRVFTDHLSSANVEPERSGHGDGTAEELHMLEAEVATHPDFLAIATQLHLLATKR